mgnify:CR=1 FL=1
MRKTFVLLAASTALLATPALAQLGTVADVNVGGQVGIAPGGIIDSAANPVGKTVDRVDGTVDNALDSTNLTLATREQVSAGAEIHGPDGKSIGTVQSVEGGTAVVMRGGKLYNVPLSEVYHGAVGATHGLVTKLSSAEVKAHTSAAVE